MGPLGFISNRFGLIEGINMQKKPLISTVQILGAVSFFTFLVGVQPSYAAFQWVAPEVQRSPVARPIASQRLDSYPLGTTIIQAPSVRQSSALPFVAPDVAVSQGDDLVLGFADNVPLAVALRQILPKTSGFVVAQNVKLGIVVSWQGGGPWRQVLADMLTSANLEMRIKGNMVHVMAAHAGEANVSSSVANVSPSVSMPSSSEPLLLTTPSSRDSATRRLNQSASMSGTYLRVPMGGASDSSSMVKRASSQRTPLSLTSPRGVDQQWVAQKGRTLREILKEWSARANIDLTWQAEYDYPLQATIVSMGSFEKAVRQLLVGLQGAQPQPYGAMHRNQAAGQMVLVIQARGNKGEY